MPRTIRVWDPFIRIFHWSLVAGFAANALVTDPESAMHRWIGYGIAALVAARLIWGFIGTRHARFSDFLPSLTASFGQIREMATGRRRVHAGHSPLGALMIYNLILTIIGISITGYMMTTIAFFGIDWVEKAHEALVTWAEISIAAHIAAVAIESLRLKVNLPKAMITGYKDLPQGQILQPDTTHGCRDA
jgi:cytochrome b